MFHEEKEGNMKKYILVLLTVVSLSGCHFIMYIKLYNNTKMKVNFVADSVTNSIDSGKSCVMQFPYDTFSFLVTVGNTNRLYTVPKVSKENIETEWNSEHASTIEMLYLQLETDWYIYGCLPTNYPVINMNYPNQAEGFPLKPSL